MCFKTEAKTLTNRITRHNCLCTLMIQKTSFSPLQNNAQSKAQKDQEQTSARPAKAKEQQTQRREENRVEENKTNDCKILTQVPNSPSERKQFLCKNLQPTESHQNPVLIWKVNIVKVTQLSL